jgi:hypothetical protein
MKMKPNMSQETQLIALLQKEELETFKGGRVNHLTELWISIITIFATSATAFCAASGLAWPSAILAAIATIFTSLQKVVDFRGRASWYFDKSARLKQIALLLNYGNISVQEASSRLGKLEVEMEGHWSKYVKTGTNRSTEHMRGHA